MLSIMAIEVCEASEVLKTIWLIKVLMEAMGIIVPIILVVSLMISITVTLVKGDDDKFAFIKQKVVPRSIAAFIVFLVPTGVNLLMSIMGASTDFSICYTNATESYIQMRESEEDRENEIRRQRNEEALRKAQELLAQQQELESSQYQPSPGGGGTPSPDNVPSGGDVPSGGTASGAGGGTFGGYTYTASQLPYNALIDGTPVTLTFNYVVPVTYDGKPKGSTTINSKIKDNFDAIMRNVANYVNQNKAFIGDSIQTAGTYNPRSIASGATASYHAFAQAIDLFNNWTYTKNGTTYYPYSGMGNTTWSNYKKFICDVCGGKEDCKYNINYVIFNNYFKGHGWCWGGNWGPGSFDPMHYEYKGNESKCYTGNKQSITC